MSRRHKRPVATVVCAIGAACVVFGLLPVHRANPLPHDFGPDSPAATLLQETLATVDAACERGDVAAFTAVLTPELFAQRQQVLQQFDRTLDGNILQDAVAHRGGLLRAARKLEFVRGASRGNRAVLVYALPEDAWQPERRAYRTLVFDWDGQKMRLAAVRVSVARPGEERTAAVAQLVAAALGG
jgi:hypothetical protein